MISLLKSILEAFLLLVEFIGNTLASLIQFIGMIPQYISYLASLLPIIPSFASAFFTAGISITVILFMLNRTE